MKPPDKKSTPPAGARRGNASQACQDASATRPGFQADVFADAKASYRVPDLWNALGLPGDPKPSCRSPFREDRSPSFSIHDDGRRWTDHGTGEGGDVIDFVCRAIDCDKAEARLWFQERLGIDQRDAWKPAAPPKAIDWPGELLEGTAETWERFGELRSIPYAAAWSAVQSGFLRFCRVDGARCFVVTDTARRSAEIRRIDGKPFGRAKAFPLRGVDKSWPIGGDVLRQAALDVPVLVTEGATDWLAAFGAYCAYRRAEPFKVAHVNSAPEGSVYIGRANPRRQLAASPFANPYRIGKDGDRGEVLAKFRDHLNGHPELVQRAAAELDGKTVACWCHPERCHGDELAEAVRRRRRSWVLLGFLGASCRKVAAELQPFMRNRLVRLVPDGDQAGDRMADHWRDYLTGRGCTVERLRLPEGRDLRDMLEAGELEPGKLFG